MTNMKLSTGIDLIEIERVADVIARQGERFLQRVYTPRELADCGGRSESLAGRWAAKEAAAKALGCGIGDVSWQEIEVQRDAQGAPSLHLYGEAARLASEQGLSSWSVSLSHSQSHAIATVIAIG
jgi:holo-[acyl-carrier protein] synthase